MRVLVPCLVFLSLFVGASFGASSPAVSDAEFQVMVQDAAQAIQEHPIRGFQYILNKYLPMASGCSEQLQQKLIAFATECPNYGTTISNLNGTATRETMDLICTNPCLPKMLLAFTASGCVPDPAVDFAVSLITNALQWACTKNPRTDEYCMLMLTHAPFNGTLVFTNGSGLVDPLSSGCAALATLGCCVESEIRFLNKTFGGTFSPTFDIFTDGLRKCKLDRTAPCPPPGISVTYVKAIWVFLGLNGTYYLQHPYAVEYATRLAVQRSLLAKGKAVELGTIVVTSVNQVAGGLSFTFNIQVPDNNEASAALSVPMQQALATPDLTPLQDLPASAKTSSSVSLDTSQSSVQTEVTPSYSRAAALLSSAAILPMVASVIVASASLVALIF